ncbi:MAG: carbamoyltransferase HypF [Phycisphaerae bacterium]|nr:carbamoyltransferase HypF [Phycisphaerae bacterium]
MHARNDTLVRRRFVISGQVQGVGFRPFVYRLAQSLNLTGWVTNDAAGVTVEAQGAPEAVERFAERLRREAPPLAEIVQCDAAPREVMRGEAHFEIAASQDGELADAQVTVDTAVCDDCLAELCDPHDPRHEYPFINCTNCGPRYTIVRDIPYDRANTTMAAFEMCPLCARQYADPGDRRFHAQPVACPRCGPQVRLADTAGRTLVEHADDPIAAAADMLLAGRIVAIKGLGGFHLACRADDAHPVGHLRRRKHRDAKPFALMVADVAAAGQLCEVPPPAEGLLTGPLRPIVLLRRRDDAPVAPGVADGLETLGVMTAYTPLHVLLFDRLSAQARDSAPPLVMTSGNVSDEPLVKDDDAAVAHLGRIADAMLVHDRAIARRLDDSVVTVHADGAPAVLRRARGYAPRPVALDAAWGEAPPILALGAELKNSVCLLRGGRALLSEHIGDLTDGRTYRLFIETITHLERLFDVTPALLAADLHPQYLSSEYAARRSRGELSGRPALPLTRVQHHHAHVAACLAEHGVREPVVGLVCDGVGYGDDGTVWGCEVLRADRADYARLGHLLHLPLPGGDAAARQTWRPAVAALYETFGDSALEHLPPQAAVDRDAAGGTIEQLAADINCPPASSLGRWFDAAAALTGLTDANRYEGEAPMRLEAAAAGAGGVEAAYPFAIVSDGPFRIDLRPMVEALVADVSGGADAGVVAARFHNTVAAFLGRAARRACEATGVTTVALSGGCFANRYLTARLTAALDGAGLTVLRHRRVPCNDGGVALGQAVVAAERALRKGG